MTTDDLGDRPTPEDVPGLLGPDGEPLDAPEEPSEERFDGERLQVYSRDERGRPILLDARGKVWLLLAESGRDRKLVPLTEGPNGNLWGYVAVPVVVALLAHRSVEEACVRKARDLALQMIRAVWPDAKPEVEVSGFQPKPGNMLTRRIAHARARYDLGVPAPKNVGAVG